MADTETALQIARDILATWIRHAAQPETHRLDLTVAANDLVRAVAALSAARWGYLAAITGLDHGVGAGMIEALYHFCAGAAVVTLRVSVPHAEAVVPSVCAIIPAAGLFERELSEMFGVAVTGAPDPARLFLPDDWPEGVYPLRKSYSLADGEDRSGGAL